MSERFFSETPITGPRAELRGAEAHHLTRVMRAAVGAEVTLFDGSGQEFAGRVARIDREGVTLDIVAARAVNRELAGPLHLGVALPKGDRQRWLVEKATELGATRLVPLICERSVAQPTPSARARLERFVIEATKQCGRNRLMEVAAPSTLEDYLATAPAAARRLFAHVPDDPSGSAAQTTSLAAALSQDGHAPNYETFVAIGPEGGFTPTEVAAAHKNGWQLVSLGPRTLRVESAALALVAAIALRKRSDEED